MKYCEDKCKSVTLYLMYCLSFFNFYNKREQTNSIITSTFENENNIECSVEWC